MAYRPSLTRLFAELQDRYGPAVAQAFMEAINDLRSAAEVQRVIAALAAGNIEEALEALHIDPAAFNAVADRIREAHDEAGRTVAGTLPKRSPDGVALVFRWDGRNPVAEAAIRDHGARLIQGLADEVREIARERMTAGLVRGDNPRQTALDLVGRVNRVTGRREGGIVGLSRPQVTALDRARGELASADAAGLRSYLARKTRDKRFDRSITKAIREGRALDPKIASNALTAMERRMLKARGDAIGLNETFTALFQAKDQAYAQAIASGKISASQVRKIWRHFASEHPRLQHAALQGDSVGFDEDFVMADGTRMRFAHDPQAPISHKAGCRCQTDYRIDWLANLA